MNTAAKDINPSAEQVSPAPLGRRIGANLLDSGVALLVIYLGLLPISLAYQLGFGPLYLAAYQSCVIAWVLFKDAWWPGQGLGKRVGRILLTESRTGKPATRLRCVGRQAIFTVAVMAFYLPAYLFLSQSPELNRQALFSSLLTVVAPIRLLAFLLPEAKSGGPVMVAHLLVLGFILLEALMVYRRNDRRRIIDLLAGVTVVDARVGQS